MRSPEKQSPHLEPSPDEDEEFLEDLPEERLIQLIAQGSPYVALLNQADFSDFQRCRR
jgi:hypothetical protein